MTNIYRSKDVLENPFDGEDYWDEDTDFYVRHVGPLMLDREDMTFTNGRPFHAVYLIYLFLKCALREVRIFSGKLDRRGMFRWAMDSKIDKNIPLYANEHVLDAMAEFLCRRSSNSVSIVVADGVDVDPGQNLMQHPMVRVIEKLRKEGSLRGQFSIRQLHEDDVIKLDEAGQNHHMQLMDKSAYRWEMEPDSSGPKAYVNLNNERHTGLLLNFFDNTLSTMGSLVYSSSNVESNT